MRLIDAEHLYNEVEKLKESPWFNDNTNGARIIRREAINIVEDLCICKEPTVCDIEQIRAEIEQLSGNKYEVADYQGNRYAYEDISKADVLQIIDKYTGGMSAEEVEHYRKLAEHYDKRND